MLERLEYGLDIVTSAADQFDFSLRQESSRRAYVIKILQPIRSRFWRGPQSMRQYSCQTSRVIRGRSV